MNTVTPIELYEAARETCLRLYVANGGNKADHWKVQPFPGTAAIANEYVNGRRVWTLCMPSLPLNERVPRWMADLIAGYTVHELLHSLWSDWNIIKQAHAERLGLLLNAIEDTRIEAEASRGKLRMVSEARRLLELLNQHVLDKAIASPSFSYRNPDGFAFILTLVLFAEKLGYRSTFPRDWRAKVAPAMLPLFDLTLARFDALGSTADAFQLARDLSALAALPQPQAQAMPKPDKAEDKYDDAMRELAENEADDAEGEADDAEGEADDAEGEGDDAEGEGEGDDAEGGSKAPAEAEGGKGEAKGDDGSSSDAEGANGHGRGSSLGAEGAEAPVPLDLSDRAQVYEEVSLNDLHDEKASADNAFASLALNAETPRTVLAVGRGNAAQAGAVISAPAALKRHVTMAVKAPERVGIDRYLTSGRLDMRNVAGIVRGADTVYRRRVEAEGREAVVSLLIDASSSMNTCARIQAARALALHCGDALKAAGVKFEIATFTHMKDCRMEYPKPFSAPWTAETRSTVAGAHASGGTAMLPAISECAKRLLGVTRATRRILLVLTDGADNYPSQSNAINCKRWRAKGVEIFGLALMLDSYEQAGMLEAFDGKVTFVQDMARLSQVGLAELVKLLDTPQARA